MHDYKYTCNKNIQTRCLSGVLDVGFRAPTNNYF